MVTDIVTRSEPQGESQQIEVLIDYRSNFMIWNHAEIQEEMRNKGCCVELICSSVKTMKE